MERFLGGLERQFYQQNLVGSTNITCAIRLRGSLEPEQLRRAFAQLCLSFPKLTANIVSTPSLRYCLATAPASLPFHVEPRRHSEQWRALMEREMIQKFLPGEGLARLRVLQDENGSDIIFCIDHGLSDGRSALMLCRQLLAYYRGDATLPALPTSPMEERFPKRFRGFLGFLRALRFVFTLAKMGPALQIGGLKRTETTLSYGIHMQALAQLNALAKAQGCNLFALFSAVSLQSLHELYGSPKDSRLSLNTPVSLRSQIGAGEEELGLFIAGHLSLYDLNQENDLFGLARACQRNLQQGIKEGRPFLLNRLAAGSKRPKAPRIKEKANHHRPSVSISNLGRIEAFPELKDAEIFEVHAIAAQGAKDPFGLVLSSYQGKLFVNLQVSREKMGDEAGPRILNLIAEKLEVLLRSNAPA